MALITRGRVSEPIVPPLVNQMLRPDTDAAVALTPVRSYLVVNHTSPATAPRVASTSTIAAESTFKAMSPPARATNVPAGVIGLVALSWCETNCTLTGRNASAGLAFEMAPIVPFSANSVTLLLTMEALPLPLTMLPETLSSFVLPARFFNTPARRMSLEALADRTLRSLETKLMAMGLLAVTELLTVIRPFSRMS